MKSGRRTRKTLDDEEIANEKEGALRHPGGQQVTARRGLARKVKGQTAGEDASAEEQPTTAVKVRKSVRVADSLVARKKEDDVDTGAVSPAERRARKRPSAKIPAESTKETTTKKKKSETNGIGKESSHSKIRNARKTSKSAPDVKGSVGDVDKDGGEPVTKRLAQRRSKKTETEPELPAEKRKKRGKVTGSLAEGKKLLQPNAESKGRVKKATKKRSPKKEKRGEGKEVIPKKEEEEEEAEEGVSVKKEESEEDFKMAREIGLRSAKFVGAHMSIAGGLENAVSGAVTSGCGAFALFLRSQRQWVGKPLEDEPARRFRDACRRHAFLPHLVLPHGSYLLNCGAPNPETLRKSRAALADEVGRCEKLGLTRYNFHPGSTCGQIPLEECLDKIGESINMVHKQTNKVMTVIENMSRQGNTVGGRFEELRGIIDRVEDKTRIGVCLDTCHAFAAGFDLSTKAGYQAMMADFEKVIGFQYLVAVHLNDSKGKLGCHLDRHEKIGRGNIGLKGFKRLMNDPRFDNIPLILETPVADGLDYADEIKLLNSLVDQS